LTRAGTLSPACCASHSLHVGHQLPGTLCAVSSQRSGSGPASPAIQKLRLFFAGGLITPAMCPLAPRTNVLSPASSSVDWYAVRHGTMWSSRDAYRNVRTSISERSATSPHGTVFPGSRRLFSRYVLRTYQQN